MVGRVPKVYTQKLKNTSISELSKFPWMIGYIEANKLSVDICTFKMGHQSHWCGIKLKTLIFSKTICKRREINLDF